MAQAGGVASTRFGGGVVGWPDTLIQQTRQLVGGLAFGAGPRSLTLSFLVNDDHVTDPMVHAAVDPPSLWVRALATFPTVREEMAVALSSAKWLLAQGRLCWRRVVGPAQALVLTLARIGWRARTERH